jgi:hypothetical protein
MNRLTIVLLSCLVWGCVRTAPPKPPEPDVPVADTEMGRYFQSFQKNIGEALGKTAAEVDGLDEATYRDVFAKNLFEAVTKSHSELSANDQALSDSGYTPAKAKEMLLRRQRECASGQ